MDNYRKWSSDELRLVDYNQGRKHGSAGGTTSFGMGSGFGGGFGTGASAQSSGFGAGGGGGLFGGQQQASTSFGQSAGTGGFGGAATGGGLFGGTSKPPATGGLFGATQQPAQSGGLFGGSSGGFGGTTAASGGFGSTTGGTGLFGGGGGAKPQTATGFSFGGQPAQATGAFGATGGFGSTAATGTGTAPGLFGGAAQQTGSGLFGGAAPASTGGFGGGGFGAQPQQTGTGLFGQQQQQAAKPLFGGGATTATGGGLFGGGTTTTPFGAAAATQPSGGLFGGQKPAAPAGGLFGSAPTGQAGTTGGGLFGGLSQAPQLQQPQQGGLFGQSQAKPGLFGTSAQAGGGGLFGGQPAQQGSLFGAAPQQQAQVPGLGGSLFGGSTGMQTAPQSLTTSINDVSAYGTPSLFQGLGQTEVQNPGPLATPLAGSKLKPARKSSILPLFKMTPGSATKFATPQKRGYGFSYSTFGTPTSPSSVASTPGGLSQSLLGGSVGRGLSKSISSSNLRRTFNPEDSILAPGAFSNSSGPRYYGSTGQRRLIIDRDIRTDLFSTPTKDKQPANDGRKLSKRVSFDTSVPTIDNGPPDSGRQSPETSANTAADLGFLRPATRRPNGTNGSKSSDTPPEMEQVKGNELAIVHEEDTPAAQNQPVEAAAAKAAGEYWMHPSRREIEGMNRVQRQQVADFTVGRQGIGSVRFRVPVDLSTFNLDDITGGIVNLKTREATVYPDASKKPPVGKGLNVPAEISLDNSWPRGRSADKNSSRVQKHIERLRNIPDTEFINYDPQTGIWTFSVEHFTTYTCEYDDESDSDPAADTQEVKDQPSPAYRRDTAALASASAEVDPDDTFDFRRKRRALPGAFDDAELSDEDDMPQQESFFGDRSAEFVPHVIAPAAASDEDMGHEDDLSENEDVAALSLAHHLPAERQQNSPYLGPVARTQETPAGVLRARMRAIRESATPMKLQVAGGDDWMDMLQKTMSPQKRDRAALKALSRDAQGQAQHPTQHDRGFEASSRMISDGKGFATSIDLMNSLFERAKAPATQASQKITPAKGFPKVGA